MHIIFYFLGISVNVYQQVVYFSEGNSIWVKGAADMSDTSDVMLFYAGWGNITSISVDWLYQRIYFVMNEKVVLWGLINFLFYLNHSYSLIHLRNSVLYLSYTKYNCRNRALTSIIFTYFTD